MDLPSPDVSQEIRDQIAEDFFSRLPFDPYPVQEEAMLSWFTADQGILVCAPTGTGKTLIAEAAIYEALRLGKRVYYTTPLIALTDQKYEELKGSVVEWGFSADDVGLVTGNRQVNGNARVLVVVAEILLNRLLDSEAFDLSQDWAVVMDEFHSFNDPSRGIVWEFGLALLPSNVKTMLLSATVGNSQEFIQWLNHRHDRKLTLVQGTERKVPLTFRWIGDELLGDQIEDMAKGLPDDRKLPALIFCFNREECWTVAEQLKGRKLLDDEHQKKLADRLGDYDFSEGVGPKLRQILMRAVGVHHAGVLPRYRRIVEELFQEKLLSVCVCTETLAAGINLPARSVVLPSIIKGPRGKKKVIDASSAHQMFGRAGRPQYDSQGYVFALAHEDDVKIERWKEKYEQIPSDTKDPGLLKARKALKKKMPKRRETQQYWNESQFEKLRDAPPLNLSSHGPLPWRLLAHLLQISPEVQPIRELVAKRLLDSGRLQKAQENLEAMLITLWRAGYVELQPKPVIDSENSGDCKSPKVRPEFAYPTDQAAFLAELRAINPLYGLFLIGQLGIADQHEWIQAFESVLELPFSVGKGIRVPSHEELPPGNLQTSRLDEKLLQLGLATQQELIGKSETENEEKENRGFFDDEPVFVLSLAEKLRLLFSYDFPNVHDVRTNSVWCVGELLEFNDFNKYITGKKLQKQEGMIFRHALRMVLLLDEFSRICPPERDPEQWSEELYDVADRLTEICKVADSQSTEKMLEEARRKGGSSPAD
ncbi:MAG: DEAD/DEAH box helicase [Planctomycetota bacterium]|nr:DEAD/DEAH box helicase [Planctomycetota bacterium]